jgi:FdhE protein
LPTVDLRDAWRGLLERRPALRPALSPYGELIDRWASLDSAAPPLETDARRCHELWARQVPLLAEEIVTVPVDEVESALEAAMRALGAIDGRVAASLELFATRWDRGEIVVRDLFPGRGHLGSGRLTADTGLSASAAEFLAQATLRPSLESTFARVREHLTDGTWTLGICPFCGGPPGFADVVEDGRRRLTCHVCGGEWAFSRTRCPFCGDDVAGNLARLELGETEEGYVLAACNACSAYIKELDRRTRWNGGPALVEDWGSPHFDVAARRRGYWRPAPPLLELAERA